MLRFGERELQIAPFVGVPAILYPVRPGQKWHTARAITAIVQLISFQDCSSTDHVLPYATTHLYDDGSLVAQLQDYLPARWRERSFTRLPCSRLIVVQASGHDSQDNIGVTTAIDDFDEVLRAAQAGEDWAVAIIYHAYHPPLIRYLTWQEPPAAEDLTGEVWLAVAQHLPTFQGDEGALRAWLFTIARRRLADYRRRSARRRTAPVPSDSLEALAGSVEPADAGVGPMSVESAVAHITSGLPREQAEILMLRIVGGLSMAETAQVVGKRPGAVRVAQHRALKRLRATLTPEDVRQAFDA